jgi:hypothetical protein
MAFKWSFEQLMDTLGRNMKPLHWIALFVVVAGVMSFQNCSMVATPGGTEATSLNSMQVLEAKAFTIINSKCVGCHNPSNAMGGMNYITNLNSLLYFHQVVPGEPDISPLYQKIQTGAMPPGQPLSEAEAKAIYDWIHDGLTDGNGVTPPPPTPVPVLGPTFTSINDNILRPKCLSCHSSTNMSGGLSFSTYSSAKNAVQPGNPGASSMYTAISSGIMPRGGSMLSSAEISAVQTWIQNGALNN